jgi:hypothetical protein
MKWVELDRREDNVSLKEMNRVAKFGVATVERASSSACIRLGSIGTGYNVYHRDKDCPVIGCHRPFRVISEEIALAVILPSGEKSPSH